MSKKIYIILTFTGTWLSRAVRLFTKDEYCHVSLSLDEDLKEMYSFGRLHAYNPISAGFVHESINFGTFKRFKNTKALIYSVEVTNNQYQIIKEIISKIKIDKNNYSFNMIGLIACKFNKRITFEKSFYCAEFVKYLTDKANIDLDLPSVIKPIHFIKMPNAKLKYKGLLRKYKEA